MTLPKNNFSLGFGVDYESVTRQLYVNASSILRHYRKTKSKAIFLQSPYLEHYPEWFSTLEPDADFAYAGYGISLSNYYEGHFNTLVIQFSKYLLSASPYEFDGYQMNSSKRSTVIFSGNPLMYELRSILKERAIENFPYKTRLLWAPHWSKDWLNGTQGFAQWKKTIGVVLDFARLNPHIEIVVRPHPILRETIMASQFEHRLITNREAIKSIDLESDLNELSKFVELLNLENVSMSGNSMLEDVLSSSHLITDGVSIIAYWATTGKPMLVIESEDGSPFNEDGREIVAISDGAKTFEEIASWLSSAKWDSVTPINIDLQELSKKLHPTFSKSPLQIFCESI